MTTNYYKLVKEYIPKSIEDAAIRQSMLKYIKENYGTVLTRGNTMAHMTASTVILNEAATKMLMIHHRIYDAWTWQGGHADGDEDLLRVALKEAEEETGLSQVKPVVTDEGNLLYRLDILPVRGHFKRDEYIAPHMHLNVAFILIAAENEPVCLNDEETKGIEWVPVEMINEKANEPEITPIYHKLIEDARILKV